MSKKSVDYHIGFHQERARRASRAYAMDALAIARNLRRDDAAKQKIAMNFPSVVCAMDTMEFAQASGLELAIRALYSEGQQIPVDSDPVELLEAYMAGNRRAAVAARPNRWSSGAVMDGSDLDDDSFVGRYLRSE